MDYEEYFSDKLTCLNDLQTARKGWGHSKESDDQIKKTLGLMSLYCPEDIRVLVEATHEECIRRIELCVEHNLYGRS